jgi:hypothetical protein
LVIKPAQVRLSSETRAFQNAVLGKVAILVCLSQSKEIRDLMLYVQEAVAHPSVLLVLLATLLVSHRVSLRKRLTQTNAATIVVFARCATG